MQYRVCVEICNRENASRKLANTFISHDRNRALYHFVYMSNRLGMYMEEIEEIKSRSEMEQMSVLVELSVGGIPIKTESLSYKEFKMITDREREMGAQSDW